MGAYEDWMNTLRNLPFLRLALSGGIIGNQARDQGYTKRYNDLMKQYIKSQYPNFTDEQIEALVAQYGDTADADWWQIISSGKDTSDYAGLDRELKKLSQAYDELGEMPELLSQDDINNIRNQGYAEIDAENQALLDLYNQTFDTNKSYLQNSLLENSQMFGDYRNQLLTNEAMRQQAIAGSTRFELDRQQRNAITRGASAAQRLVASINTQLGLQAQSAQQSLDTSNALAQNLLAHRQAQEGIRNAYLDAQNTYANQRAGVLSGQAERRFNYGQSKVDAASQDRERAYDAWIDRRDDYFRGDSLGSGIYGSGRRNKNNGI